MQLVEMAGRNVSADALVSFEFSIHRIWIIWDAMKHNPESFEFRFDLLPRAGLIEGLMPVLTGHSNINKPFVTGWFHEFDRGTVCVSGKVVGRNSGFLYAFGSGISQVAA